MTIKETLHEIIFEAETTAGKLFDIALFVAILGSVITVMLESVESYETAYGQVFFTLELVFTFFFSVEYVLRLYCSKNTKAYAWSFFGIVDLLSTLPFYIQLLVPGAQSLAIVRGLRIMRIFRVLKLNKYAMAGQQLGTAMKQAWPKILIFLMIILTSVSIMGALMYLVEGRENGFSSIPRGVYWAVVTMTTVGYGDLSPKTDLGQFIAVTLMVLGYGVIAVPTGIVSAEVIKDGRKVQLTKTCSNCFKEGHEVGSNFCNQCGTKI